MLKVFPMIDELERLILTHQNLLCQQRWSYPPFQFCEYVGEMGHSLYIAKPEEGIYSQIKYILNQEEQRYYFLSYMVVKRSENVIGRISLSSLDWNPRRMSCDVEQLCNIGGRDFLCKWNWDNRLVRMEINGAVWETPEELKQVEHKLGCALPWQIDPLKKVQEVLDLSGYRQFFEVLVAQTPCDICREVIGEHTEKSDHKYQPFLIYTATNTHCKVCLQNMYEHDNSDHKFDSDFPGPETYRYFDFPRFFSWI